MKLAEMKVNEYLDVLKSDAPAPGGGSASALAAAQGVGLVCMVCDLTLGKEKYAEHQEVCTEAKEKAADLYSKLVAAIDKDTEAFNLVSAAFKMPKGTDEEKAARSKAIADGTLAELFQGIRYWSPEEFRCRCGEYHAPYCDGFPVLPDRTLLEVADDIRDRTGVAHRSSAIRCPQHNADSGGVSDSRHLRGKALDFFVEGYTANRLLAEVQKDSRVRYAYAIDGSYVHMDVY